MLAKRTGWAWDCAVAGVLTASTVAGAHDFWIIPDVFFADRAEAIRIRGQTSSLFPTSLSAVTVDRIVDARIIVASREDTIHNAAVVGTSLVLAASPSGAGQHVIAVRLAPRNVRETPESFRRYLDLEGAPEARLRYEREGRLPPLGGDSITRRYAKYAKTFVEIGRGPRAFGRPARHPLELMPLNDPGTLRVGDTLRLRLDLLGKGLAGAKVHAGAVSDARAIEDTAAARRAAANDVTIETNPAGVAAVGVDRPGIWNVRTIQIVPARPGSGADWDVHWATITFRVAPR